MGDRLGIAGAAGITFLASPCGDCAEACPGWSWPAFLVRLPPKSTGGFFGTGSCVSMESFSESYGLMGGMPLDEGGEFGLGAWWNGLVWDPSANKKNCILVPCSVTIIRAYKYRKMTVKLEILDSPCFPFVCYW